MTNMALNILENFNINMTNMLQDEHLEQWKLMHGNYLHDIKMVGKPRKEINKLEVEVNFK
jgi:hypothetical protein